MIYTVYIYSLFNIKYNIKTVITNIYIYIYLLILIKYIIYISHMTSINSRDFKNSSPTLCYFLTLPSVLLDPTNYLYI